jgi:hypothetical protein
MRNVFLGNGRGKEFEVNRSVWAERIKEVGVLSVSGLKFGRHKIE